MDAFLACIPEFRYLVTGVAKENRGSFRIVFMHYLIHAKPWAEHCWPRMSVFSRDSAEDNLLKLLICRSCGDQCSFFSR